MRSSSRAHEQGWEGLIAKRADSRYKSGKRTPDWRKMKILREQEFVVGGWTDPESSRTGFGALLLGVYEGKRLIYAGHVGTGFNERELARRARAAEAARDQGVPVLGGPARRNEKPHWVKPTLVAQVRFTEWTDDGVLRHPVYLGLRDDKKAASVTRERLRHAGPGGSGATCGRGRAEDVEIRGEASASVRAGGGAPAPVRSRGRHRRQFAPGVGPRRQ